jgi:hypothetical protein
MQYKSLRRWDLLGRISRFHFALGLDEVLGGVNHGAQDGPAVDGAVVRPHVVQEAADVRVDAAVLRRPGKCYKRDSVDCATRINSCFFFHAFTFFTTKFISFSFSYRHLKSYIFHIIILKTHMSIYEGALCSLMAFLERVYFCSWCSCDHMYIAFTFLLHRRYISLLNMLQTCVFNKLHPNSLSSH